MGCGSKFQPQKWPNEVINKPGVDVDKIYRVLIYYTFFSSTPGIEPGQLHTELEVLPLCHPGTGFYLYVCIWMYLFIHTYKLMQ